MSGPGGRASCLGLVTGSQQTRPSHPAVAVRAPRGSARRAAQIIISPRGGGAGPRLLCAPGHPVRHHVERGSSRQCLGSSALWRRPPVCGSAEHGGRTQRRGGGKDVCRRHSRAAALSMAHFPSLFPFRVFPFFEPFPFRVFSLSESFSLPSLFTFRVFPLSQSFPFRVFPFPSLFPF